MTLAGQTGIVLTRDDYERYATKHPAMIAYLQSLLATRTFLFVGVSLADPNFRDIYAAIRHAVGANQRRAFLLTIVSLHEPLIRYWAERGINVIKLENLDVEAAYVQRIGDDARGSRSLHAVVGSLGSKTSPPGVEPDRLARVLTELQDILHNVVARARSQNLADVDSPSTVEAAASDEEAAREEVVSRRARLRALLDLSQIVDQLTPLSQPDDWADLGDMLYGVADSAGAIRAYNQALRPFTGQHSVEGERLTKIRGNLARAYAREGHYQRSEQLLRKCVFLPGRERSISELDRPSVFHRLDFGHLMRRPTDASALVYAMAESAERLRQAGHFTGAFTLLREARYVLEPLLGLSKDPSLNHNVFAGSYAAGAVRRQWARNEPSFPMAYAYNFLGKCYRLSCLLALDLQHGSSDVRYYLDHAVDYCRRATAIDSRLPYPWAHRLLLQAETRLSVPTRQRLLDDISRELRTAIQNGVEVTLIDSLLDKVIVSEAARDRLKSVRSNVS